MMDTEDRVVRDKLAVLKEVTEIVTGGALAGRLSDDREQILEKLNQLRKDIEAGWL